MPSYLFRCDKTGEEKELFISPVPAGDQLSGWTETVDGETRVWKRVFTPPAGIIFRGSGFYSTGG